MAGLTEGEEDSAFDLVELRLPGDTGIDFLLSGRLALDTVLAEREDSELLLSSGNDRLTGSVSEAVLTRFAGTLVPPVDLSVTPPVLFLLTVTGVELETRDEEDAVGLIKLELTTAFFLVVAARFETLSGLLLPSAVPALSSFTASAVVSSVSSSALAAISSILESSETYGGN